jgi:hypothetical protein
MGEVRDPSLTLVGVFTEQLGSARVPIAIDTRSERSFLDGWVALVGRRRRPPRLAGPLGDAGVREPALAAAGSGVAV